MAFTLSELAQFVDGSVVGNPDHLIEKLGTLDDADGSALSFLANPKYRNKLDSTQAGAVLLRQAEHAPLVNNAIIVANPYLAFAQLTHKFVKRAHTWTGIHDSAVIADDVVLGENVRIGPNVVIEKGVVLGDEVEIGASSVVGANVRIGNNSRLAANVTIYYDVIIGDNCLLHSGAVIGADGFGFAPSAQGWTKIMQLGAVIVGNKVEIGANTTIDRGAIEDTRIGNGVIIDNQVQIAHNVIIGDNSAIAGCSAIAGSTQIGAGCTIAGGVGIIGHLTITDNVHITAMSLVSKSIDKPGSYSSGTGLEPTEKWRRSAARLRRIDEMAKQITTIEVSVNKLTQTEGKD
ncbi:UDP-3-O-(3-hydroxymyristoyl)glucosamine N-acyltransferase [Marinomonas agarivorans]|nr:UDP-3-O-(3-hydroxymyristoyl)glucosamine N-acyltransferase [Marinomonas agarivorans]